MNHDHSQLRLPVALLLFVCFAGCQRQLVPSPNVVLYCDQDPFANVPEPCRRTSIEVLYATDRVGRFDDKQGLVYGYQRSPSLAFGTCRVTIGADIDWEELCRQCREPTRRIRLPVTVDQIHELQRLAATPMPEVIVDGVVRENPAAIAEESEKESAVRARVGALVTASPKHEIYLYIHGAGNDFKDSASTIAEVWHFLGRQGVPMVYAWPSGFKGSGWLQWYARDRESGEFTIFHLKQCLRIVSSCPEVRKLHIIAHSRGTDVIATALRELNIECLAAGKDPRAELKIGNLVLAAADMDVEVAQQRIAAERLARAVERLTLYVSQRDLAMSAADWLFAGENRLGKARFADLTPHQQDLMRQSHLQIIEARVTSGFIGHSYFYHDPAVFSDLILLLRDNRPPGKEHGRPLTRHEDGFWELHDGYPIGHGVAKATPELRGEK